MSTQVLQGRRAIVTGGASGIGAAIARKLALDGAQIVIVDLNLEPAQTFARQIGAQLVQLDLIDLEKVAGCFKALGHCDILVNSAGTDQHAFFTQTDPVQWRRLIAVNLESVFATTHAVLPGMQAAGYGRIINIGSEAGRLGSRGGAVYAAAKAGVQGFTRSIARENGLKGITANVVAPGPIDTPMLRQALELGGEKVLGAMSAATLVGRLGTADEVAATVAFLASDAAGFITGEVIGVSGGMGCGQ